MATESVPETRDILVLIDGNAMVHRAFHAVPEDLTTRAGERVNATFGFAMMLIKALLDLHPQYIAVTFDRPTPTFRHVEFAAYKAQRPPMPDYLRPQFARVRQVVEAFNIPLYELDGYEGDDLLGTLARQATESGLDTIIVTGDMDTLQLVGPHVHVLAARRGMSDISDFDEAAVVERMGVAPALVPDWKALTGDTSDNIPGVPGIGGKTAAKLLQTYGSLENVLAHADELPARQRQLVAEHAAQAIQSKHLATIVTDAPVTLDLARARAHDFDRDRVIALFRELEFNSLVDRVMRLSQGAAGQAPGLAVASPPGSLPITGGEGEHSIASFGAEGQAPIAVEESSGPGQLALFDVPAPEEEIAPAAIASAPTTRTTTVTDPVLLGVLAGSLRRSGRFALDVETDLADEQRAHLVGISLAMGHEEAYYIPIGHGTTPAGEEPPRQLSLDEIRAALGPVFADPAIPKVAHNGKFDCAVLERHGMPVRGLDFDTMVAAYLLDPGRRGLGLKDQALEVLGVVMTPITSLIGTGQKQISMVQVPVRAAAEYAGADADMTWRLMEPLAARLRQQSLWDLFTQIEMPLLPVLQRMERAGILIDLAVLERMAVQLDEQIAALEKGIYAAVGHEFNINSTKQLGDVLFVELKLPTGRKTKTGYSVDAEVLEALTGLHPAVDLLLEYRTLVKLKSTYVDSLRELVNPDDGRVHTSFSQTTASSGRLSSSNPNLQNIPVRTEAGRQIRRAFVATPGHLLLAADYAQAELRILAHITHEPALVAAFEADQDIHRVTASRLYGIPPEQVSGDQRRMAKTVTYAIIYGQSPFGLARTAGMSREDAQRFIQTFEESFPRVKDYVRETIAHVRSAGYVQTLLGRKRFLPNLLGMPVVQRQAAEREAINMPIQGSNADIIKKAMISLDGALIDLKLGTKMVLQVHDELIFEVPDDEMDLVPDLVRAHMEGAMKLSVPLRVELKSGRDWYSVEAVQ
jgi:DNA polymerase-1